MKDRDIAYSLIGTFCGETLCEVRRVDFTNRAQRVCYDYIHGGNKNRDDYEYLVEQYRLFQKLSKDNWIIRELLK